MKREISRSGMRRSTTSRTANRRKRSCAEARLIYSKRRDSDTWAAGPSMFPREISLPRRSCFEFLPAILKKRNRRWKCFESEFIHRPSLVRMFNKARDAKTDYEMDYRIVLPDGSIRYAHSVGRPVFNASGNLVEYVGTTVDVTEHKCAEAALRASERVARGQVEALAQN